MASESKLSPNERLMRKRLAARLRQQRCRARKKELSLAKKQREQKESKGAASDSAQTRKPVVASRNHAASVASRVYSQQPLHRPHQPHQPHKPHQPHRPHLPHHAMRHPVHLIHCQQQPQLLRVAIPPPPHRRHPGQPHYLVHRPTHPLYMTEPPARSHSIGSVVSFEDGSCPLPKQPYNGAPLPTMYLKHENLLKSKDSQLPVVPTVSPTMSSSKAVVEPDSGAPQLPSRSPTKEETAIDAMLSLRSGSFGV